MELDNKVIGKTIGKYRKMREMKASHVAEKLGLSEAAYTKYERGETAITIDHLKKVAEVLDIDPLYLLSATPHTFVENITNSPMAFNIGGNSTLLTCTEEQTTLMLKLMDSVISLNERLMQLLEKK